MSEPQKEESQKTVVSFVVGLLIGGLLVWAFSGNNGEAPAVDVTDEDDSEIVNPTDEETTTGDTQEVDEPEVVVTLPTGDGKVSIGSKAAGTAVPLASATFPVPEGWVGVRDMNNDQLGSILGVVRFSETQGLVPEEIILQRPTVAGKEYAVVFFTEDGDRSFNSATDVQIDTIFATFTAE